MFVIIWRYSVAESNRDRFEAVYGSDGAWADLFEKANGYLGTELLRSDTASGEYMTVDRWQSPDDFKRFKRRFDEAYRALDAECESLTESETHLGYFSS